MLSKTFTLKRGEVYPSGLCGGGREVRLCERSERIWNGRTGDIKQTTRGQTAGTEIDELSVEIVAL